MLKWYIYWLDKQIIDKYPKFQVGYHVRISECKNIFTKGYTPKWSEKFL